MTKQLSDFSPIFIIGNPRSGTTLLRLMLTCHKNICIPPECSWIVYKYYRWKDFNYSQQNISSFLDDLFTPATRKIETWKIDKQELNDYLNLVAPDSYRELVDAVYFFYISKHDPEKNRWGDKNNVYLKHILEINDIIPGSTFIHLIRDPRGVVNSYKQLTIHKQTASTNRYVPSLPSTAIESAQHWLANIQAIERQLSDLYIHQYMVFRYEDLLLIPEKTLTRLCIFLNESYDKHMLDFYKENKDKQLEPTETMLWKQKTYEAVDPNNIDKWKVELSIQEIKEVEEVVGDYLEGYGYSKYE